MKKLLLLLLVSLPLLADSLKLEHGSIAAHTEMMMDTEINPLNKTLFTDVRIDSNNIESLSGEFWVDLNLFTSDKKDRDEHMYEALDSQNNKLARYTIIGIIADQETDTYTLEGILSLHGQEKNLNAKAKIFFEGETLKFRATTTVNMPEYGIEMPCMVFMCVRDTVDLVIEASFTK